MSRDKDVLSGLLPDLVLFVPGKLINVMNRKHAHWAQRARWAREWRRKTQLQWLRDGRPVWRGGLAQITITAHVARLMDVGALGPTVKPVEDEALFLMLGGIERLQKDGRIQRIAPDGPKDGHQITYTQDVRPDRGVHVVITALR